jgi:hypothetical protein
MKIIQLILLVPVIAFSCDRRETAVRRTDFDLTISKSELLDKIKGGWAGQVIGCTYGGPTEFRFQGSMIHDYMPIPWDSTRVAWYFDHAPGLYDDVYMDLTFVEVMEKEGIDAPASSHALAFAHAPYPLWHANQAARYNILNGIMPPESGFWKNNPHADDIDFQIEADFSGLMSPGLVNAASAICDRVGHVMNYGNGWYGGVYMAAMYSLAFVCGDIETVVTKALDAIPEGSGFRGCMEDVISCFRSDPDDWKKAWFAVESRWAEDTGCPDGVFRPFNIDATVNAAYVVIGLLYGKGDFARTLEISTRCGQDSDCNPASAGGILGTMMGYSIIPPVWKDPLKPIESKPFAYTALSLEKVYETSFKHALEIISRNGGRISGDSIILPAQEIIPVKSEACFPGHRPAERKSLGLRLERESEISFNGIGFVLTGEPRATVQNDNNGFVFEVEVIIDDQDPVTFLMPMDDHNRRDEIAWAYELPDGAHRVKFRILNPVGGNYIEMNDLVTYRLDGMIRPD